MTMPTTGSVSVSGLLGGTAGQIDTVSLINSLMQAASLPQTQLKDQLAAEQTVISAYQAVNTAMTSLQNATQVFTDPLGTIWQSTAAASSDPSVSASTTSSATVGAASFNVLSLAAAQVSTVAADSSGNVVSDPSAGITIKGTTIALASGSAADVAKAINAAAIGIRASVVAADGGQTILQLAASNPGTDNAFDTSTITGLTNPINTIVAAANAQIGVGNPAAGGYTVSSQSNTFTNAIPGVTFTVSALASNVQIGVRSDISTMADKVSAMVSGLNSAAGTIGQTIAKGAVLQGSYDVTSLQQSMYAAISAGGPGGASLHTYGIDLDSTGKMTFDSGAFATAYLSDPTGTQNAIKGLAATLNTISTAASDPTTGTITAAINTANAQTTSLNTQISSWTDRLATVQASLQQKYTAMQVAMAQLQSQQTYLTSMFNSMNPSKSTN
jgi:flagellar hook-associated protein 2